MDKFNKLKMSFKQFEPKSIKDIPKSCRCKENVNCNIIVISATKMFNFLFRKCKTEQLEMFGLSKIYKTPCYIYMNNFCIMIDTTFRLLYNFGEYYNNLVKKFGAKQIIIIDDLNKNPPDESFDKMRYNATMTCPKKWNMYNYMLHGFYSDDEIYKQMMWKLKSLSKFLDEDEYENFDCWEVMLSKKFPGLYDFCLRGQPLKLHNFYIKNRILSQFVYLIALTQMQLSQFEIYMCWKFVLRQIRKNKRNDVLVYECENGGFDYNITHIFSNQRTLFVTDEYVNVENIFFYDHKNIYYPCSFSKLVLKDSPNEDAKIVKRIKRRKEINNLIDLFDICEEECNGKVLDINSAYTLSIFSNIKKLYVEQKFDELMPDKIEETEYSWVTKDYYIDVITEWINSFNKISKFKII